MRKLATVLLVAFALVLQTACKPDITLHVVATTDLHGYLLAQNNWKGKTLGGVDVMSGYFNTAKKQDGETLFLDSGDLFQGTLISNDTEGASVIKYYNYVGYTAAAIGNHDFDFGPVGPDTVPMHAGEDPLGALKARESQAKFPFLSANICSVDEDPHQCEDATDYRVASFVEPYLIKSVHNVQVGIIGLTTQETPETTMPQNVARLRFMPLTNALERFIPEMKKKGAQVIVVIAHSGGFCEKGKCETSDEIFRTLDNLSATTRNSIAIVLAGHTHNYLNKVYDGVPIMIEGSYGRSFGYTTLQFHAKNGSVSVEDHQIIDFTRDGNFLGERITPDAAASDLIAAEKADAEAVGDTVVGKTLSPLKKGLPESSMGDFMTDAFRACYADTSCQKHADIAFQNNGGIRSELDAGAITYGQIFQVMPFDNFMAILKLSGRKIHDLLTVWYQYQKGFPQISGIQIAYSSSSEKTRVVVNDAGETEALPDPIEEISPPLHDDQIYTVVMSDFLATGGGGTGFITRSLKPAPFIDYTRKQRDALVDYLKINPSGVDYSHSAPRLVHGG